MFLDDLSKGFKFNSNLPSPKPVDPDNNVTDYGAKKVGPTLPKYPQMYSKGYVENKSTNPDDTPKFDLSQKEINYKKRLRGVINSSRTNENLGVFRGLKSDYFGNNPQRAIDVFEDTFNVNKDQRLVHFDIESLGINPKDPLSNDTFFAPTEFAFAQHTINGGKFNQKGKDFFLSRLTTDQKDMVSKWLNLAQYSNTNLEDFQQRTLVDLMKYGRGADFDGDSVAHSEIPRLLKDKYGTIDFSRRPDKPLPNANPYTVELSSGKKVTIDPVEEARRGLENLQRHGDNTETVAKNLQNYIKAYNNAGSTWVGYNSASFDQPAINRFMTNLGYGQQELNQHLDLYELIESSIAAPTQAHNILGLQQPFSVESDTGMLSLENLVPELLGRQEQHQALQDTIDLAEIHEKVRVDLFNNIQNIHKKSVFEVQNQGTMNMGRFAIDELSLTQGDTLIATSGTRLSHVDESGFRYNRNGVPVPKESNLNPDGTPYDFVVDNETGKIVTNQRSLINSRSAYTISDQYTAKMDGETMYGMELIDKESGNSVYVNRRKQRDLQKFVHQTFEFGGDMDKDKISRINQDRLDDLARGRFRKLTSTRSGGGYWSFNRFVEATEVLRESEFTNDQGMIVDANGEAIKDRKRVLERMDEFINDSKYSKQINEAFSLNRQSDEVIGSFKRDFRQLAPRLNSEFELLKTLRDKADEVVGTRSNKFDENIRKSMIIASSYKDVISKQGLEHTERIAVPDHQKYSIKLPISSNRSETIAIGDIGKTESDLNKAIWRLGFQGEGRGVDRALIDDYLVDVIDNQIGPRLRDAARTDGALDRLDKIRNLAVNKPGTGSAVSELASFLNEYQEHFPTTGKVGDQILEVESLNPRHNFDVGTNAVDRSIKKFADNVNNMYEQVGDDFDFSSPMNKFLEDLDNKINMDYKDFGLQKTPMNMEDVLKNYVKKLTKQANNKGLGVGVYSNFDANNPMVTIAMFNSTNKGALGKNINELNNSVARIDVPLISQSGYVKFGKQKKIAPLALLDRVSEYGSHGTSLGNDAYLHSAFDRVIRNLNKQTSQMVDLASKNQYGEIKNIADKAVRESIENLSGSARGDDFDLTPTNSIYDMVKRYTIGVKGFYSPIDRDDNVLYSASNIDEAISSKEKLHPAGVATRLVTNDLENDKASNLKEMLRTHLGQDVDHYLSSARGDQLVNNMVIPLMDIRKSVALGHYNDAGRPNMVQMFNSRDLTKEFIQENVQKSGVRTANQLFAPGTHNDAGELVPSHLQSGQTFNTRVKLMSSEEVFRKMHEMGVEVDDPTKIPTVAEDQTIFRASMENTVYSTEVDSKVIDKKYTPNINHKIYNKVKDGEEHRLEEGEYLYEYRNKDGNWEEEKFSKKVDTYLTDINELDNDDVELKVKREYKLKDGTKLMLSSEKSTMNKLDDDIFNAIGGKDVDMITDPDFAKHGGFGNIATGYFKEAMWQINQQSRDLQKQSGKVNQVKNIIENVFKIQDVKAVQTKNGISLVYSQKDVLDKIRSGDMDVSDGAASTDDYVNMIDDLNKISGVNIDPNTMVQSAFFSDVNENWYATGVEESGWGGAKYGPREIGKLRANRLHAAADWLEGTIASASDADLEDTLRDEYKAMQHLLSPDAIKGESAKVVKSIDEVNKLRKSGIPSLRNLQPGLFTEEQVKGTILDPDRDGMVIELPEAVKVDMGTGDDVKSSRHITEVYMPNFDLERTDKGYITQGEVGKKQSKVVQRIREYYDRLNMDKNSNRDYLPESKDEAVKRIRDSLQGYYNQLTDDIFGKKGRMFDKVLSNRMDSSSINTLKTINPLTEMQGFLSDENKVKAEIDRMVKDESLKGFDEEKGKKVWQSYLDNYKPIKDKIAKTPDNFDANTVYVGKERAAEMLDIDVSQLDDPTGLDKETKQIVDNVMGRAKDGHHGLVTRYPTNFSHSVNVTKAKVSDKVGDRELWASNTLVAAMKGDSDGDTVALVMARGGEYSWEEFESSRKMNLEQVATSKRKQDMRRDFLTGLTSDGRNPLDKIKDKLNDPGSNINSVDIMVGDMAQKLVGKAKGTNPALTGYTYNTAERLRQLGKQYFEDKKKINSLMESVGALMQVPISGKHASKAGIVDIDKQVLEMVEGIRRQEFGRAKKSIGYLQDKGMTKQFLKEKHVDVFEELSAKVNAGRASDWDSKAMDAFLSQRLKKEGVAEAMNSISQGAPLTENTEKILNVLEEKERVKAMQNQMDWIKKEADRRLGNSMDDPTGKVAKESAQSIIRNIQKKMAGSAGGFSILGATAMLAGGMVAGGMVTSGGQLPMDRGNQPGMRPRNGSSSATASLTQGDLDAFQVNVSGRVKSTLNKGPEELAGIAAQAIQDGSGQSMNVSVNATDNRNDVSEEWLKESVLELI
jgi:hypothetical protein